jgi:hypothetical protein
VIENNWAGKWCVIIGGIQISPKYEFEYIKLGKYEYKNVLYIIINVVKHFWNIIENFTI